jgi:hypothetical protein
MRLAFQQLPSAYAEVVVQKLLKVELGRMRVNILVFIVSELIGFEASCYEGQANGRKIFVLSKGVGTFYKQSYLRLTFCVDSVVVGRLCL